jgi:hypothetical protein
MIPSIKKKKKKKTRHLGVKDKIDIIVNIKLLVILINVTARTLF